MADIVLHTNGAQDAPKPKPTKSIASGIGGFVYRYFSELLVTMAAMATGYVLALYEPPVISNFQNLQLLIYTIFMMIGLVIMFNTAQTRVAAGYLQDVLHEDDDGGGKDGEE